MYNITQYSHTDLGVRKEEDNREVLEASLEQTVLYVLSPFWYSVVLGELYLETVVVSPAQGKE